MYGFLLAILYIAAILSQKITLATFACDQKTCDLLLVK